MYIDDSTRREFLGFVGRGVVAATAAGMLPVRLFASDKPFFRPIPPNDTDKLIVGEGLEYHILSRWGDPINKAGDAFGANNDFTAFVSRDKNRAFLWVNHENPEPLHFISGYVEGERSKEQVEIEQKAVGGSVIPIKRKGARWVRDTDEGGRRIDARTKIPFAWPEAIAGSTQATGTLANCAGGVTPWGSILTCEENYQDFYGELDLAGELTEQGIYGWRELYQHSPHHYGWVVEVNPVTGRAKKLVALGRFSHEGATVSRTKDGRCVVYSGDDAADRCFYKFISEKPNSLERGTLYVADLDSGRWISLERSDQPVLREKFRDQTEVLVHTRLAAELVGGTRLERPEQVAIDPKTGAVYLSLTNHIKNGNYFGHIRKFEEANGDPGALKFRSSEFLAGGPTTGFACPDNLCFDPMGNLWFATDMSGRAMNQAPYGTFKNNGLFYVKMSGNDAGIPKQVASAPTDAEFTGISCSPDGRTLFLSVQHPGETSPSVETLTSTWPDGSLPKSAVVTISAKNGSLLHEASAK